MKLYYVAHSPFARKARIVIHLLGLEDRVDLISTDIFNTGPEYKKVNPLIKVPALIMENGDMLVNSPFICQYLASLKPQGSAIFPQGPEFWRALNIQAIADGAAEACVARRWEKHLRSPEKFDKKIDQRHKEKIENAMEYFENHSYYLSKNNLGIAEISVISLIGYLDFRFAEERWQHHYPRTYEWARDWDERSPSIRETSMPK